MFKVTKKSEKKTKTKFITQYDSSRLPEIKLNLINQIKIESLNKDKPIESSLETSKLEQTSPKKLFSILHNQYQIPKLQSISSISNIKRKRKFFINDESTIGRWTREEHKKFIEAIIKFGNNWKKIQEYVQTRTITQARSHAQKFFDKIKKNNIFKKLSFISENNTNSFTNISIQKLYDNYHNCSQEEINLIVDNFLNIEYDLSNNNKKNLVNNKLSSLLNKNKKMCRNKIITNNENINNNEINKINEKNDKDSLSISIDDVYHIKKTINNEIGEKKIDQINFNNDNNQNNLIYNSLNINNNYGNNINNNYNNFNNFNLENNNDYLSNLSIYNQPDLGYIFNQFINNLSQDNLSYNPCRFNTGKNTFESVGGDSIFLENNNFINLEQQNKNKSRKNSMDLNSKFNQNNDNNLNDFIDYHKRI